MSTPFLIRFSEAVVSRLVARGRVEIAAGQEQRVVAFVAAALAEAREGAQLVSTMSAALLRCPDVEELYADEDELKQTVDDLAR